jgi:DNA-binding XRE family transcriptional regulator
MTRARDRIRCVPLDSDILMTALLPRVQNTLEPVALLMLESYIRPDAVLVSVKATGVLAAWQGGVIKSLDQRKAQAALDHMRLRPTQSADDKAEIAAMLKEWRGAAQMTQARAAQVLGIPKRTYEGIEGGKGFAYPQLLALAIHACKAPQDVA